MIKIECGDCRGDMDTGDLCFCESCYRRLEEIIERLETEIESLKEKKDATKTPEGV